MTIYLHLSRALSLPFNRPTLNRSCLDGHVWIVSLSQIHQHILQLRNQRMFTTACDCLVLYLGLGMRVGAGEKSPKQTAQEPCDFGQIS